MSAFIIPKNFGQKLAKAVTAAVKAKKDIEEVITAQLEQLAPASKPKTKKEKKEVDPAIVKACGEKPKRPISCYIVFSNTRRKELKAENPEMKNTELTSLLGAEWKELSEKKKLPFKKEAEKIKAAYEKKMEVYNKKLEAYNKKKGPAKDDEDANEESGEEEEKPKGKAAKKTGKKTKVVEEEANDEEDAKEESEEKSKGKSKGGKKVAEKPKGGKKKVEKEPEANDDEEEDVKEESGEAKYKKMSVADLKKEITKRNKDLEKDDKIDAKGSKADLIARLVEADGEEIPDEEEIEDAPEDEEIEDVPEEVEEIEEDEEIEEERDDEKDRRTGSGRR